METRFKPTVEARQAEFNSISGTVLRPSLDLEYMSFDLLSPFSLTKMAQTPTAYSSSPASWCRWSSTRSPPEGGALTTDKSSIS